MHLVSKTACNRCTRPHFHAEGGVVLPAAAPDSIAFSPTVSDTSFCSFTLSEIVQFNGTLTGLQLY
jgi:hypothetical protein